MCAAQGLPCCATPCRAVLNPCGDTHLGVMTLSKHMQRPPPAAHQPHTLSTAVCQRSR